MSLPFNLLFSIFMSVMIWSTFVIYYKKIQPRLQIESRMKLFEQVKFRNLIVLTDLLPKDQKDELNREIRNNELDSDKKFKQFYIIIMSLVQIQIIKINLNSGIVNSNAFDNILYIILLVAIAHLVLRSPFLSKYEFVWYNKLKKHNPELQITWKNVFRQKTDQVIYLLVREYIEKEYPDISLHMLIDHKLQQLVLEEPKYNKNEKSEIRTLDSYRRQHLGYDKNLVFGYNHERFKTAISITILVNFLLVIASMSYMYVTVKFDQFTLFIYFTFFGPLLIMSIALVIQDRWFINPKLDDKMIVKSLDDQGVFYNPDSPYQAMRDHTNRHLDVLLVSNNEIDRSIQPKNIS